MAQVKTVVVCHNSKVHNIIMQDTCPAKFVDIFPLKEGNMRLNITQKENVDPDDFRVWVKDQFKETEIKSMY